MASGNSPPTQRRGNSKITTIIFDADGVVVDSEKIWDEAQTEFSRRHGIPYERAKLKPLLAGRSQAEAIEILKVEYGLSGDAQSLAGERMALVKRGFEEGVEFMSGFREFFQRIRSDYQTCIATSMPEELLAIIDGRLGLSKLFGGQIYSLIAVGYRSKPNPDIFLHAAKQLGAEPANCLVIEDAPHGVEAARRAGMKCVGLTTTFDRQTLSRADCVVDSFAEIDLAGF
ncbi:MAG: HAD family phosphatase [Verrucomicrobia bacterium]|jgi:HAD superfamily hydrolase (TIGR01509 family)|nr:HAD family phosphatase [Verrucomicrobiota bacterium]